MSRRAIQYAIHADGYVVSRVGSELAWPVLDYSAIGKGGVDKDASTGEEGKRFEVGDFNGPTRYDLERMGMRAAGREWFDLAWTRKIPLAMKNYHRAFWGMAPVRGPERLVPCEKCRARIPVNEAAAYRILDDRSAWSRVRHICRACYAQVKEKA